jgi:ribonuclease G
LRKQVLVTVDRGETRVAMLEASGDPTSPAKSRRSRGGRKRHDVPAGYRVAEIYFERRGGRSIVGNIYKGRVDNVLPGLEAAFVDIGLDKNGFLHVDEIVLPGVEQAKRGRGNGPRITDLLKPGQEIVVQVVKDPLKTKGARLSMEITIAGRYMVYAPTGEGVGVSRRLEDKERDRLRKEARQLDLGGGGAIIRTAAHGATRADFERELQYLFKLNDVLHKRVEATTAPALVFQEADLSVRVVRDIFSAHFERAIVDDEQQHHRLVSFFSRTAPELVDRVELYDGSEGPLFEVYGVDPVIEGMLERRVDLPSGGYLIIDYAEALTVIDVNTGSFTGKGKAARLEDTITKTNLEAAEEAVRQLRLRDIGGIIVIDFIDMARSRNREAVLKVLRKSLDEDRTKTFVVEISPLGLVEMTRQNVTDGVREIMTKHCPVCHGEGVVKSEETVAIEFARHIRHMVKDAGPDGPEAYLLRINPRVTAWFIADGARELHALEEETGRFFHFEGSEGLPLDYFAVTMEGTRAQIEEHAVPFRAGEEVHVDLVEPHMYNDDDAVAKIDGYLIDVVNGVAFVGEKKLVRIEEAGRTIARAVLVGADAEAAEEAARERVAAREKAIAAARRSAAAKKGAARRREREEAVAPAAAEKPAGSRRRRKKADADPDAGTAASSPSAAGGDSDAEAKPSRRRRGRGAPEVAEAAIEESAAAAQGAGADTEDPAQAAAKPAGRRRSRAKQADGGDAAGGEATTAAGDDASGADAAGAKPGGRRRAPTKASEEAVESPNAAADAPDGDDAAKPAGRRRSRAKAESGEPGAAAKPVGRKRSRAAEPVDEPDAAAEVLEGGDDGDSEDGALSSRPRRRGRRGGRRRSRAKAQADAEVTE